MHDEDPAPREGQYQAPTDPPRYASYPKVAPSRKNWRNGAGGIAVGLALLGAKFKTLLFLLLSYKWFFLGTKLLLSFGSIFASIWVYALVFGWKLGVVFVLLILAHEMGHWVVLRGFGVRVSLPYFIPGLGAFVAQKEMTASNAQDAAAAIAGPGVGIAASVICQVYGIATNNPFWIVAAHLGYFVNLFNLIPVPPFDGGRIAGSIDPRLWIVGLVLFAGYLLTTGLNSPIAWLFLIVIAVSSVPRTIAAWRGAIDPRVLQTSRATRGAIALAYFAALAVAALGAAQTSIHV